MDSKRLPDLPESENREFWDQAEISLHKIDVEDKHEHFFEFDGDNRHIKCKKCGVGYIIGALEQLKEGHLYYNGDFMF